MRRQDRRRLRGPCPGPRACPGDPTVGLNAARFLIEQGQLDDAEQLLSRDSCFEDPCSEIADACLASLLDLRAGRGDLAGACDLIAHHTEILAAGFEANLPAARVLRCIGQPAQAADLLSTLDLARLAPQQRAGVLFGRGDAYDQAGDTRRAFADWTGANRLQRTGFDSARFMARVDELIEASPLAGGDEPVGPGMGQIVVLGLPCSGAQEIAELLRTHPASPTVVEAAGDAIDIRDIARTDPATRFVYCFRDPLDAGLAMFASDLRETHDFAADLTAIGAVQRGNRRLMDHWRAQGPVEIHGVSYEELARDSAGVERDLWTFCGLSVTPADGPVAMEAPGRSGAYLGHLGPLCDAQ